MSAVYAGLAALTGAAFVLSLLLTAAARRAALAVGYVDRPGGHKSHAGVMPYGGGVAIFLCAWGCLLVGAVVLAAAGPDALARLAGDDSLVHLLRGAYGKLGQMAVILTGAAVLLLLGLADDLRPLGPLAKLGAMTAVALVTTLFGDVRLLELGHPFVSLLLSTLWIVVITNSLNFLDNMDGLAAGVASICLGFLGVCGLLAGQVFVPAVALLWMGAALGFLVHNFPPARVFMGDAGSLVLGYILAVASIMTSYWESGAQRPPWPLAMPLCVLAVPLYDFCSVVLIRWLEGRNPLRGDQRHFSHRLVERGLTRRMAVLTIYLATATSGLAATLLPGASMWQSASVVAIVLMVLIIIAILEAPLGSDR